jgi:hypothetical protein
MTQPSTKPKIYFRWPMNLANSQTNWREIVNPGNRELGRLRCISHTKILSSPLQWRIGCAFDLLKASVFRRDLPRESGFNLHS